MFGITPELFASLGIGGVLLVFLCISLIKNYFDTKKEAAKDSAETSLYNNLAAENTRMSAMLRNMSAQMDKLMQDNSILLARVNVLENSVRELSVWESKAFKLQEELIAKDALIIQLRAKVAEQAAVLDILDRRGKNENRTD